jgi:hypothetical protein
MYVPMFWRNLLSLFHGTTELGAENATQYTEGRIGTGAIIKPVGTNAMKRDCSLCMEGCDERTRKKERE